ncbi:hypothetical protein SLEP1_g57915 [Rubroshorea leprosula]|uniref:Uncharacterized protein n=1 Tax=Rubroshorea leprosula TaxID=152421 RepID=A0AAV5MRN6_9ROSI|nr:hypothetical protein SLEP1_g57915 [Rubroshorea leprosula]
MSHLVNFDQCEQCAFRIHLFVDMGVSACLFNLDINLDIWE